MAPKRPARQAAAKGKKSKKDAEGEVDGDDFFLADEADDKHAGEASEDDQEAVETAEEKRLRLGREGMHACHDGGVANCNLPGGDGLPASAACICTHSCLVCHTRVAPSFLIHIPHCPTARAYLDQINAEVLEADDRRGVTGGPSDDDGDGSDGEEGAAPTDRLGDRLKLDAAEVRPPAPFWLGLALRGEGRTLTGTQIIMLIAGL